MGTLERGTFNARFLLFPLQMYVLVVIAFAGPPTDEEYPTKQLMNTVPVVKLTYVSVMVRNDPKNNFALSNSLLSVFPSSDVVASCSVCMMSLLDALSTAELTVVASQKSVILAMGNNWNISIEWLKFSFRTEIAVNKRQLCWFMIKVESCT